MNAAGIVLCGGRSSRMGQDKNFLSWNGGSFLQHAVDALEAHCQQVLLVTSGPDQVLPHVESKRLISVVHDEQSFAGPAIAFYTALHFLIHSWADATSSGGKSLESLPELIFLTGNDSPALKPTLVELLLTRVANNPAIQAAVPLLDQRVPSQNQAVSAQDQGGESETYPLCAAYSTKCLPTVHDYLAVGGRSMKGLLRKLRVDWVPTAELQVVDPNLESLLNINTPADYCRAEANACNTSIPRSNCSSDAANDKRK